MIEPQIEKKLIYTLQAINSDYVSSIGPKAAHLGDLLQANFRVPEGIVLSIHFLEKFLSDAKLFSNISAEKILQTEFSNESKELLTKNILQLEDYTLAIRSSAIAEDLPNASFAGMYETFLNVKGIENVQKAIKKCWASYFDSRVSHYSQNVDNVEIPKIAVIIQRQIMASSAGVLFTLNPVTGNPNEIKINSTKGIGEKLVSGEITADEWLVTNNKVISIVNNQKSLSKNQVKSLASIGKRIEDFYGKPQDIEWAFDKQQLFIVQARPITTIPEFIDWTPEVKGGWMRHFRLGEWLGEPVTPLFATWLLERLDSRIFEDMDKATGVPSTKPYNIIVNGWYYAQGNFVPPTIPKLIWFGLRYMVPALIFHPRRVGIITTSRAYWSMKLYEKEWREKFKIEYEQKVDNFTKELNNATTERLLEIIEELSNTAGDNFYSFITVGGSAWKPEAMLAEFYKKNLENTLGKSHQVLLQGLGVVATSTTDHQVTNLDWYFPTLGELKLKLSEDNKREKIETATRQQKELEHQAREILKNNKKLLKKFDRLLSEARDAARLREEQVSFITIGWPVMRQALLNIGNQLVKEGIIEISTDIFFLNYDEVNKLLKETKKENSLQEQINQRKTLWEKQKLLSPPDTLGKLSPLLIKILHKYEGVLGTETKRNENNLYGMPASAGKISGKARVILSINEFHLLEKGEILVAPITGPAWTPLFSIASAVVTDTGSIMAHASLIAREYGIPAIVGTGNATKKIHTGDQITVNGNTGEIEFTGLITKDLN